MTLLRTLVMAHSRRAVGHTTAAAKSALASNAIYITADFPQALDLRRQFPGLQVFPLADLERRMPGRSEPVVVDHFALTRVCAEAQNEIDELQKELQKERRAHEKFYLIPKAAETNQQWIGRYLKESRLSRGVSQPTLAKQAKISKGLLSKIEAGYGNPTVKTLTRIAAALNIQFIIT